MFLYIVLLTLFFGNHCCASQAHVTLDSAAQAYHAGVLADDERDDEQSESQRKRSRLSSVHNTIQPEDTTTEIAAEDKITQEDEVTQEQETEEWVDPQYFDLPELISYIDYLINEESLFHNNTVVANYATHVTELYRRISKRHIETKGDFSLAQGLLFNTIGGKDPLFIRNLQRNL